MNRLRNLPVVARLAAAAVITAGLAVAAAGSAAGSGELLRRAPWRDPPL